MPATQNSGGDRLASGAVRCTFKPAEVTQEKWNSIFGDDSGPKLNCSDTNSKQAGTPGTDARKTRSRKK